MKDLSENTIVTIIDTLQYQIAQQEQIEHDNKLWQALHCHYLLNLRTQLWEFECRLSILKGVPSYFTQSFAQAYLTNN